MIAELTARPDRQHAARRARAALAGGRHDLREARGRRTRPARSRTGSRSRWSTRPGSSRAPELLEPTSGNTGISLALVAKLRGLQADLRDAGERDARAAARARALRGDDRRLAGERGLERSRAARPGAGGGRRRATRCSSSTRTSANPRAHYEGTGAEIVRDLPRVDALVAGLGTGGTLMGTGARLREAFPDVVVAAAEPLPGDPVMGLRSLEDGYVPPILDVSKLDRKILVSNAESVAAVHALLEREGHLRRRLRRARSSTSRAGSPRSSRRARSSSPCSPTAAGSTCPATSGRPRTSRSRWRARSGGSPGSRSAPSCTPTPPRRRRTSAAA